VPVEDMVRKFSYTRFEPSGFTGNQDLPQAQSVLDYMFRWMEMKFGDNARAALGEQPMQLVLPGTGVEPQSKASNASKLSPADGQTCSNCGTLTIPNGGCHVCPACGTTTGCG
ncbi:MAG: vitamin B12-dependent ribonucleotide reductase, partial [Myxococcota bacterium]|nr:vitamin B12-dependent ribonucleotide reductase [Myxococcota bacterium]